jgi:hypothetical protein
MDILVLISGAWLIAAGMYALLISSDQTRFSVGFDSFVLAWVLLVAGIVIVSKATNNASLVPCRCECDSACCRR